MSRVERLQAMEALWDSLLYENQEIGTPECHEEEIEERKKTIADGNAKFVSLSELKATRRG
ncbi:MAG: addiction module protein [Desulfobacteraceae bacterium]|nr:addiction module protein [Desulfobacteraceae bacterium]